MPPDNSNTDRGWSAVRAATLRRTAPPTREHASRASTSAPGLSAVNRHGDQSASDLGVLVSGTRKTSPPLISSMPARQVGRPR